MRGLAITITVVDNKHQAMAHTRGPSEGQALYCILHMPRVFGRLREPCSEGCTISPFTHREAEVWVRQPT